MLSQPLADYTLRNAVNLEGLKAGEVENYAAFLVQMDESLRARLSGIEDLTEFSRSRIERLVASTRADLRQILDDYQDQFQGRLGEYATYQAQFEARALDQIGWESVVPAASQVRSAIFTQPLMVKGAQGGMLLEPFLKEANQVEFMRVSNAIRQGAYEGLTIPQLITRIRGTSANAFQDGILAITARNAEAVARTAIQHVSSVARMETWRENDDVVIGYRWLSTLDSRTSTICRSLDNQVFKFDKGPLPPAHIRCRSTTLAELDGRYKYLDTGGTRAGRSTRTGKTVDVPAESNYYHWLKQQPKAFQNQVLGPTRAKLLRDGGLTADRFARLQLDKNFRPLSLEEMRKLEPVAFERAFGSAPARPPTPGGGSGGAPLKRTRKARSRFPKGPMFEGDSTSATWSRATYVRSPDWYKKRIAQEAPVKVTHKGRTASAAGGVRINMPEGYKTSSGRHRGTWAHEYGHIVDARLAAKGDSSALRYGYRSAGDDYVDAMAKDRKSLYQGAGLQKMPGHKTKDAWIQARKRSYEDDIFEAARDNGLNRKYMEGLARDAGVDLDEYLNFLDEETKALLDTPIGELWENGRLGTRSYVARSLVALKHRDGQGWLDYAFRTQEQIRDRWDNYGGGKFSDLIGSTTKNRLAPFGPYPGHSTAYYSRGRDWSTSENFANFSAMAASPNPVWWTIAQRVFPNGSKLFREIMEGN